MSIKFFSTAPTEDDVFWQVVLFPTVTVLRNREFGGAYYAVNVEWLFWSITTILNDN